MPTRRILPRGISKPVTSLEDVTDELPRVLRELLAANDQRRERLPVEDRIYWNGYGLALADVWRVFQALYDGG